MARPRPRRALGPTPTQRAVRVTVPVLAAGALLSGLAIAAWPQSESLSAVPAPVTSSPSVDALRSSQADRPDRSTSRPSLAPSAGTGSAESAETKIKKSEDDSEAKDEEPELDLTVIGNRYATAVLNLRTGASKKADVITTIKAGRKLSVTDTVTDGFRLIKVDGKARWVTDKYLSKSKPKPEDLDGGISTAACAGGSSVERGLTDDAVRVHRALCARFPQIRSYGGVRSGDGGFHGSGRAVDCMISDRSVGQEIADWVRANAKRLGVSEVIYAQRIWTVKRGSEGWRGMSDRGSATANHYDHVHVSVYGSSGTA